MKQTKRQKILFILTMMGCGALTALPFLFGQLWFLSWLTLAPMIYILLRDADSMKLRQAYSVGLFFGWGYYGVMYHWFTAFYPMDFAGLNGTESIGVIALCWLGLATMQALELGVLPMFYRVIASAVKSRPVRLVIFTVGWVTFEWTQTIGWRGVPWGRLVLSQWKVLPFLQSASLFGGSFVSGLMVAVSGCIAAIALKYAESKSKRNSEDAEAEDSDGADSVAARIETSNDTGSLKEKICLYIKNTGNEIKRFFRASISDRAIKIYACVAVGIIAANTLFGAIRIATYDEKEGEPIKAAVIQGNISSLDKFADNTLANSSEVYLSLTEKCVKESGAQLVLWAETAIPVAIDNHPSAKRRMAETADRLDITLIIGAFELKEHPSGEIRDYNALIAFLPDGTEVETRYYKRHLVPFAESLPMEGFIRTCLPILVELNLIEDPLGEGTEANVFKTELGNIGGIICFDSIFPELSVDAVRNGAQLLAVSTNDSWFADSGALHQHNHQSQMRAIETGRYVVRSANTGVSSIITPEGEYLAQIPPLTEDYATAEIYMRSDRTLYTVIGDLFSYACLSVTLAGLLYSAYINIRKKLDRRDPQ